MFDLKNIDEKQNANTLEQKLKELQTNFLEMAQLKSDFSIEKYTIYKEGNFIAHQYHFLMRQYRFALSELKRMIIERERLKRKQKRLDKENEDWDLDNAELENQMCGYEIDIKAKMHEIENYEKFRKVIEERNGGAITNKQYQEEEPLYWEWNLANQARGELIERNTGISKGVVQALDMAKEKPALTNSNNYVNDFLSGGKDIKIEDIEKSCLLDKQFIGLINK